MGPLAQAWLQWIGLLAIDQVHLLKNVPLNQFYYLAAALLAPLRIKLYHQYHINFYQSFKILFKERPKLIISTGADVCLGTIILGKLFFKTRLIFIESAANVVTPTLTGRISYFFSDLFIIQHKDLIKYYPKAKLSKGFLQ